MKTGLIPMKLATITLVSVMLGGCMAATDETIEDEALQDENVAEAASAVGCQYKVIWQAAGVYEKPTNASKNLKTKHAGDIVGGYCELIWYNPTEGNEYLAVTIGIADDKVGWMRRQALVSH